MNGVIFFKKMYVSVEDLLNVEELLNIVELVSVEDAPSARSARYGMKINILECCRF